MTAAVAAQARNTATASRGVTRDPETINEISALIERSYEAFNTLYEPGDFERFPWLENHLSMLEEMADTYSPEKLHDWLASLYKRYRSEKRGEAARSTHS